MARYTGPKTKIARKFGEPIFGDDKSFEKRNYPPGQHGNNKRRGKKNSRIDILSITFIFCSMKLLNSFLIIMPKITGIVTTKNIFNEIPSIETSLFT